LGEENLIWAATVAGAVAIFFLTDWTTDVVEEALELAEYDHDPRAKEDVQLKCLPREGLASLPSEDLKLSVAEQIEVERSLRSTLGATASREQSATFLILCWALFSIGVEAFFRTPNTPLQPWITKMPQIYLTDQIRLIVTHRLLTLPFFRLLW
jgi:hypothetical protein